jgi:glucan phosphoethanolaminetransferase (alkaline phosphatase superfamily)
MIVRRQQQTSNLPDGSLGLPRGLSSLSTLKDGIEELSHQSLAAIAALILVLLAYYLSNPFILHRFAKIDGAANKGVFVIVHIVALVGMMLTAASTKKTFYLASTFCFFSVLLDNCFFFVKQYPITLSDLSVLLVSLGNTQDAISEFHVELLRALFTATLLVFSLVLLRMLVRSPKRMDRFAWTSIALSFVFYLTIAAVKGEPSLVALPSSGTLLYGVPIILLDNQIHNLETPAPFLVRENGFPIQPSPQHIVLIIDESVEESAFLKLNSKPFSNAIDFGFALSGANCSAASNYILRVGPDDFDLSRTIRATPTLFELAKRAGFETIYFDLQGVLKDTAVHNYFSERELAAVDRVVPPADFSDKRFDRDLSFAMRFADLIRKDHKIFAIVNKVGSHFPYAYNLPPEMSATEDPYSASVSRSSVDFLHEIDSTLPDSTLVFYTSDHGQNLLSKSPHCNGASDSTLAEWSVPLIIFASKDLARIRENLNSSWIGHASHFELAETIRVILGYEPMFNKILLAPASNISGQSYRAYFGPVKGLLGRPASYRNFTR